VCLRETESARVQYGPTVLARAAEHLLADRRRRMAKLHGVTPGDLTRGCSPTATAGYAKPPTCANPAHVLSALQDTKNGSVTEVQAESQSTGPVTWRFVGDTGIEPVTSSV
jgi:hypothetical protein